MQKIIGTLFALSILFSCDYSTSSNGNIDAAFAREEKHTESHGNAHHGPDAAEHKDNNPQDHEESHAAQGESEAKVVPTDTAETQHAEQPAHH